MEGGAELRRRTRLPENRFDTDARRRRAGVGVPGAGPRAADEGDTGLLSWHADGVPVRVR